MRELNDITVNVTKVGVRQKIFIRNKFTGNSSNYTTVYVRDAVSFGMTCLRLFQIVCPSLTSFFYKTSLHTRN